MNELFAPPESGLLISYLRVSLEDENTGESESISNQRDLIGCYLKQHPEFTAYKVMEVVDDGHSGTNFDRPGIKRVLELVRSGKSRPFLSKISPVLAGITKRSGAIWNRCFPFLGSVLYLSTTAMTATNTLAQPGAWTSPAKLWFTIFTAGIFPER